MYYQSEYGQALEYYKKSAHIDFLMNNKLHIAKSYAEDSTCKCDITVY